MKRMDLNPMKLVDLMKLASKGYPDGLEDFFDKKTGKPVVPEGVRDTLALFVVIELSETFDPEASAKKQKEEAVRALERAIEDLHGVITALEEA